MRICLRKGSEAFDILSTHAGSPCLKNNRTRVKGFFSNNKSFTFYPSFSAGENIEDQRMSFSGRDEASGLEWKIQFATPPDSPFAMWIVELANYSTQDIFIEEITLLEPDDSNKQNVFFGENHEKRFSFYSNGWQSWSSSGAYLPGSRMRRSNLGILQNPMVINPGTPCFRSRDLFSSDFFGILADLESRSGLLLGFLSQRNHFGSLSADLRGKPVLRLWANGDRTLLKPGARMTTDWAVCYFLDIDAPDELSVYFDALAQEHGVSELPPALAGWCSWYYYYEQISEQIIGDNLKQVSALKNQLPLDLIQIDDGFEAQVGDWLETNVRFPQGMAALAKEIKSAGYTPGIWLAPFILHPNSVTAVEHPDWLLRRANGKLSRAGFGWNSLAIGLDLTVPDALEYACGVVDTAVHRWGYPYLKLDFLYAAALRCVYHDPTHTRAQVLRGGMEALRRAAGKDTILLGCGAPLGSVIGLVQAMRIGADVSASWKPRQFGIGFPIKHEPHMPCARNSIQNIITRAGMHRRWWVNDPDCLLVRPDSRLNLEEVQSLATAIAMTGGSVFISDNMTALPEERLEIAAALLPPMRGDLRVLDWMDAETPRKLRIDLQAPTGGWHLLAYFNWQDSTEETYLDFADFDLKSGEYWVRSFWDERVWRVKAGAELFRGKMKPHAALVLAVRAFQPEIPTYLGSSLHISQGLEVKEWEAEKHSLSFLLSPGRRAKANIDLYIPGVVTKALYDDQAVGGSKIEDYIYRFNLQVDTSGRLELKY